MSKLKLYVSEADMGDEGDFADVLRAVAEQIEDWNENGGEPIGKVHAGLVTASWSIREEEL